MDRLEFGERPVYWGIVAVQNPEDASIRLGEYDDDEYEDDDRYPLVYEIGGPECVKKGLVPIEHVYSEDQLSVVPDELNVEWITHQEASSYVYAVLLHPDVSFNRLKVGTTVRFSERMRTIRTTNPTAMLVGLWPGDKYREEDAHKLIDGRLGKSEVFEPADVWKSLAAVHTLMTGEF